MLTRNNVVWAIGMLAGALSFVVAHFNWLHLAPEAQGWIELAAVFVGGGSAALRQSPLPHSESANQSIEMGRVLLNPPGPTPSTPGTFGRPNR